MPHNSGQVTPHTQELLVCGRDTIRLEYRISPLASARGGVRGIAESENNMRSNKMHNPIEIFLRKQLANAYRLLRARGKKAQALDIKRSNDAPPPYEDPNTDLSFDPQNVPDDELQKWENEID